MLIEFEVTNFKSIKEPVTLNMYSSSDKSLSYNLIDSEAINKDERILKSSIIYGPNASGKSNVLKALSNMKAIIVNSSKKQKGDTLVTEPFKFEQEYLDSPTTFRIVFVYKFVKYQYSFSIDKEKIHYESLYYWPNKRRSKIFERHFDNYTFTVDQEEQNALSKRTLSNRLYLSAASEWNYEKTSEPFTWFKKCLRTRLNYSNDSWIMYTAEKMLQNDNVKSELLSMLLQADIGINNVNIAEKASEELVNDLMKMSVQFKELLLNKSLKNIKGYNITTTHQITDDQGNINNYFLNLNEESLGTKKMFELVGPLHDVLNNGYVLVFDELENSLHPMLVESIVKAFHKNNNAAQLIFTTHNTNLLNQTIFRRDQIWFTEKKQDGSTELFSLAELKPRKDENIEKGYLAGRYGAIPFIDDILT